MWIGRPLLSLLLVPPTSHAWFVTGPFRGRRVVLTAQSSPHDDATATPSTTSSNMLGPTRRTALQSTALSLLSLTAHPAIAPAALALGPPPIEPFTPARRCTCYLVDSTIPPTLVPYRATREAAVLKSLGKGEGTSKAPLLQEEINLNNVLNKLVFGTMESIQSRGSSSSKGFLSSFVFLGTTFHGPEDVTLVTSLVSEMIRSRRNQTTPTAIGLGLAPIASQDALDVYLQTSSNESSLSTVLNALQSHGLDRSFLETHYRPILEYAHSNQLSLLALAPNPEDLITLRTKGGLDSLSPQIRQLYVADPEGFIDQTRDAKFQLYTEKSLLKDVVDADDDTRRRSQQANYFAERILVHETGATVLARWAAIHPNALVIGITSIPDVRFMGGMNGRVLRIYNRLLNSQPSSPPATEDAVTTILLNPTAKDTLSESKFLRLEIGTAPNNWKYQTKLADYVWFSSMPKVNLLPRMMNEL